MLWYSGPRTCGLAALGRPRPPAKVQKSMSNKASTRSKHMGKHMNMCIEGLSHSRKWNPTYAFTST